MRVGGWTDWAKRGYNGVMEQTGNHGDGASGAGEARAQEQAAKAGQEHRQSIDELLPSDLLSDDETVLFALKPSLWTVLFLSFRTVVIAGAIAVVTLLVGPMLQLGRFNTYILQGCAAAVVGRVGFALLQWLSRTYVLTDRRVIRVRGVFTIDIFQCQLTRIQNTFLVLTLAQRIFNLGNVELTTAGTGHVEAVWRDCRDPLKVHHRLLQAINRASNPAGDEAVG